MFYTGILVCELAVPQTSLLCLLLHIAGARMDRVLLKTCITEAVACYKRKAELALCPDYYMYLLGTYK